MNFSNLTRTGAALVAGVALFAAVSVAADALTTFNVSTTVGASCVLDDDFGPPGDLTPTYNSAGDSGTGSATVLATICNGTSPTVAFTDGNGASGVEFVMKSGANSLVYFISNNAACNGTAGDNAITVGAPQSLSTGFSTYDICAAVIVGGPNTSAPFGSYSDTVTYTISP